MFRLLINGAKEVDGSLRQVIEAYAALPPEPKEQKIEVRKYDERQGFWRLLEGWTI